MSTTPDSPYFGPWSGYEEAPEAYWHVCRRCGDEAPRLDRRGLCDECAVEVNDKEDLR